eukprot:7576278-Pyramimonas_sp.AAC.1
METGLPRPPGGGSSSATPKNPNIVRYMNTHVVMRTPLLNKQTSPSHAEHTFSAEVQNLHDLWGGQFASKYQPKKKFLRPCTDDQIADALAELDRKKAAEREAAIGSGRPSGGRQPSASPPPGTARAPAAGAASAAGGTPPGRGAREGSPGPGLASASESQLQLRDGR